MTAASADLDVHLILRRGEDVLLGLRSGTAHGSGEWALPCGKVDPGESVLDAAVREAHEELGITLAPADLVVGQTVHARHGTTDHLGVFFEARTWTGTPTNREPGKCAGLRWFPLGGTPAPLMDYSAAGLRGYLAVPGGLSVFVGAPGPRTIGPATAAAPRLDGRP
ncbi:NUDIX domain-containing protein [Streptomyces minutiscleroticus]|uniref:Nudix hydrolase domain-containing protein n=1 Tax=Streptomyces minutiscleroticus TaxID=68238 RepID=A0A918KDI6_9ACTN|nr:NUDIX domain-containing protein [Streptomyces minutiscleroticus]GGX59412.1 hypothetical protein GCM10010358_12320 [Streptomyces minutiscleroticus]